MKYTAGDIASRLAANPRSVAEMLLPAGKEKRGEWLAGSIGGEAGESLKVCLAGPKVGRWCDFADESVRGDLLDLWAATRGLALGEALAEALAWLGLETPKLNHEHRPATLKAPKGSRATQPDSAATRWLHERGFSDATIRNFRIAEHDGAVMFPAFSPAGKIQYAKYRATGKKQFWSAAGGVPCLFGWQAMPGDARSVTIAEGECDCLAWAEFGVPALSPTNGAANLGWIDTEFDNLARFDTIFLAFDMDDAGQSAVAEIADRLGRERCRIVELAGKDANDCLAAGITTDDMLAALARSTTADPDELVSAASFEQALIDYRQSGGADNGVELPFAYDGSLFKLRRGELIICAGYNGSGKSELANQLTLHAMRCGERTCIGSFEFKPLKLMDRIHRQAGANDKPAEAYSRAISRWFDDKLWLFVPQGPADTARLIEVFEYAVRRYGIRWFVVDNLAKCGIGEEDYDGQKKFVERLGEFARDFDVTVLLCAHQRKAVSEEKPSGKMDVKGSGAITDLADSVMVLWKNKAKAEEREKADAAARVNATSDFDEADKPDGALIVEKQRNGETEPRFSLWYDFKSHQYVRKHGFRPIQYVPWESANRVSA